MSSSITHIHTSFTLSLCNPHSPLNTNLYSSDSPSQPPHVSHSCEFCTLHISSAAIVAQIPNPAPLLLQLKCFSYMNQNHCNTDTRRETKCHRLKLLWTYKTDTANQVTASQSQYTRCEQNKNCFGYFTYIVRTEHIIHMQEQTNQHHVGPTTTWRPRLSLFHELYRAVTEALIRLIWYTMIKSSN